MGTLAYKPIRYVAKVLKDQDQESCRAFEAVLAYPFRLGEKDVQHNGVKAQNEHGCKKACTPIEFLHRSDFLEA